MGNQYSGKERVEGVFQRQPVDRLPIILSLNVHLAPLAGYGLNEARLDLEKAWKTFLITEELLPSDMVRVPGDPYLPDAAQARSETSLPPRVKRVFRLAEKSSLKTFHPRPAKENNIYIGHIEMCKKIIAVFPDRAAFSGGGGPRGTLPENSAELSN